MQRELSEPSWLKSEPNLPLEPHSRGVWISSPEVCKVQDLCCDFVHGHTFPKGRPMKGNRMLQKSSSRTDQSQMDGGLPRTSQEEVARMRNFLTMPYCWPAHN